MPRFSSVNALVPISGFSVDSSSKDEECDKVITQLACLIELGKVAQSTLDTIRTTGYFEGIVPIASDKHTGYHRGSCTDVHAHHHTVRYAVLQKRQSISRADLPELGNLQLSFGKLRDSSYGGHDCKEVELFCEGLVARQIDQIGTTEFTQERKKLGSIRINKSHLSFVEDSYQKKTSTVYKTFAASPKSVESAQHFARCLGVFMMDTGPEPGLVAKTLDLQKESPTWFIEDGVVERMFGDIHQMIRVIEVMDA